MVMMVVVVVVMMVVTMVVPMVVVVMVMSKSWEDKEWNVSRLEGFLLKGQKPNSLQYTPSSCITRLHLHGSEMHSILIKRDLCNMHFSSLKPSVQPSARIAITRPIGSEVKLNSSAGHKLTISRIWQVMTAEGRNLKDPKRDILCNVHFKIWTSIDNIWDILCNVHFKIWHKMTISWIWQEDPFKRHQEGYFGHFAICWISFFQFFSLLQCWSPWLLFQITKLKLVQDTPILQKIWNRLPQIKEVMVPS